MKKIILTLILAVIILTLAACGNTASETGADSPSTNGDTAVLDEKRSTNDQAGSGEGEFQLPAGTLLMLGTLMLEESEYAVDAEQAAQLLPLWKALRSFGESETTAQVEIDAVISQIEDSMTPEQISAIEAMNLSMQDMAGVAEVLGVEMSGFGGDGFGEMTPEMQATREAMRESGQMPGGGPGGGLGLGGGQGPGGGFDSAEMDRDARATAIAERGGVRGARSGINSSMLDAIIEFLEAKIQ